MSAIKIETKTNGYTADGIQKMIGIFEKAVEKLFPSCTVRHFYYGDFLDMTDVIVGPGEYCHFNLRSNRVSINGFAASDENFHKFKSLTFNDELYDGKLMELAKA